MADSVVCILVTSFAKVPRRIPKRKVVASSLSPPTQVVDTLVTLVALLEYREIQLRKRLETVQLYKPLQQATTPEETPTLDHLTLNHFLDRQAGQVRYMLRPIDSIWDGTLREINTVKNNIDLVPRALAAIRRPFRAVSAAYKEIEKNVQRMRDQGVLEQTQLECALPVVLETKLDGSWLFFSYYRR